jgi:UDP-2,4-diacetamido-2,4,6-trideoxy-beta-L-altropyranose hydrolase
MREGMLAVFRCDASSIVGAGHLVRCVALGEALHGVGVTIAFAGTAETFDRAPVRMPSSWTKLIVSGRAECEPRELAAALSRRCDILVIDHYGRDGEFERACRSWANGIVVIEDMPTRRHDCDILLDAAGSTGQEVYAGLVPTHCRVLLGPTYAPLRRQFVDFRPIALKRREANPVKRIFVSFGGADSGGGTTLALDAIERAGLDVHVDVVIGSASPQLDQVKCRERAGVTVHVDSFDLANLMTSADLAIGACGGTAWERCCLGLPSILVSVADNQLRVASTLTNAGAGFYLGHLEINGARNLTTAIGSLASDSARRAMMSCAGATLVDGLGGSRVVDTLCRTAWSGRHGKRNSAACCD